MDSGQFLPVKEVNGINLDNYFPYQSSFNTVVYVHKRFCTKSQQDTKQQGVLKKEVKRKIDKEDKAINCDIKDTKNKREGTRNDSVLQQTIKFAKNLVPIALPPSEGSHTPVYYTIKTCNKCKKKDNTPQEIRSDKQDNATFEKKRSKKLIETFKKEKNTNKESYSERYSVTHSSESSTMHDLNMNQSLCCTLSELSDKKEKSNKKVLNKKRKVRESDKIGISESFECLATEINDLGETKIKIQLMNDKEKHFLSERIGIPVLDAVKDCVRHLNTTDIREEVIYTQKLVKVNSQRLDAILDKLTVIERNLANTSAHITISPKAKAAKVSRLEQLSEDLMVGRDFSSEEELPNSHSNRQRKEVSVLYGEDLGCGEISGTKASTSVGVKTDRHRLPARFCWTDAGKNN